MALTPAATSNLVKKGVKVRIEEGAGALAQFNDEDFHKAGANVVSRKEAFQSDVVLKVCFCSKVFVTVTSRFACHKNRKRSFSDRSPR